MNSLLTEFGAQNDGSVSLDRDQLWKILAIGAAVGCSDEDVLLLTENIVNEILHHPNNVSKIFEDLLGNARKSNPQPLETLLFRKPA